jgi:hypothetical protein
MFALSNWSVYLRRAASPFFLTSSSIGFTDAITSDKPVRRFNSRAVTCSERWEIGMVNIICTFQAGNEIKIVMRLINTFTPL